MITGKEHWTTKKTPDGDVKLFLWEKFVGSPEGKPAVPGMAIGTVPPSRSVVAWPLPR